MFNRRKMSKIARAEMRHNVSLRSERSSIGSSKLQEWERALQIRESKVAEREEAIQVLECQGKNHIHKDAQQLRTQLNGARVKLDFQRQYVEEKRCAAEAITATMEEREARHNEKQKELQESKPASQGSKVRAVPFDVPCLC
jgi:hypothetical protein